ncbi:ABC transporter substrate-binding protein [Aeromicrobium fastidiosum]|uniref:ABC transporter substrate-binding protein n=1 Tax=Aeromicrobium fastidiosum TaxID=52699 RepID=UPI00165F5A2C|nr:ABC transporter substrate-binding protein [Aeromicrobium fastidiosum]MBP2390202.1 peptide/nickel transport system substrate-binding protein [Aeromicrobium fastidiosum]
MSQDLDLNRRNFLRIGAAIGLTLTAGGALAACDSGSTPGSQAAPGYQKPKQGGQFVRGIVGDGPEFGWNPFNAGGLGDYVRNVAVYDTLVFAGVKESQPALLTSWDVSEDSMTWTLHLRENVTWHDGSPFIADDVVFSLNAMATSFFGASVVTNVDVKKIRAVDSLTVEVPMKVADAGWIALTTSANAAIVKNGTTDFSKPNGTGAFVFASGTPGQRATFKRNDTYWVPGAPYPDTLIIVAIADDNAALSAVRAGQIDAVSIPLNLARSAKDLQVTKSNPPAIANSGLVMKVDAAPFDDVRVRQAMALAVDRELINRQMFLGEGIIMNDLIGKGKEFNLPFYDDSLAQRTYDPKAARALLKQAGHDRLSVELVVTPLFGADQLGALVKESAKAAGFDVTLKSVSPDAYFNPQQGYLSRPFTVAIWPADSLRAFYDQALGSAATSNESSFKDSTYDTLFASARAERDEAAATEKWAAVQKYVHEQVPYIWPANGPAANVYAKKVHNVFADYTPDKKFPTAQIGSAPSGWQYLWVE